MFVIRSKSGLDFVSTNDDATYGKEMVFKTRKEATSALKSIQSSFRDQDFFIEEN